MRRADVPPFEKGGLGGIRVRIGSYPLFHNRINDTQHRTRLQ